MAPIDPFLCYKAAASEGSAFEPRDVELADAAGIREANVVKPRALCAPTLLGGEGTGIPSGAVLLDPIAHLASYKAKDLALHEPPGAVCAENALDPGGVQLDTERPARRRTRATDRLLVPSSVNLTAAPPALGATEVDAFACYKAALAAGATSTRRTRAVDDALGPRRNVEIGKPKHLCVPVAVDDAASSIQHPDGLLVCYDAKLSKGQTATPAVTGVHVRNLFAEDQRLDAKKRSAPTNTTRTSGTIRGDANEVIDSEDTTRPGVWSDIEGRPRWAGGGPLGDGDWLRSSFSEAATFPEGEVEEWRVFVVIDVTENETDGAPGVGMTTTGIPGIPDGLLVRPKAPGKPRGLRASSEWFTPPEGTTLDALAGATQDFDPRGDDSDEAFAFVLKDWGVEFRLANTTGGSEAGSVEEELCLPSVLCAAATAE
ncbi:MAG TPA: hypothetical protein VHQ66_11925 [Myxococcota bacterium]|nr:hypothetical protein [Myxococcota bacterium]